MVCGIELYFVENACLLLEFDQDQPTMGVGSVTTKFRYAMLI